MDKMFVTCVVEVELNPHEIGQALVDVVNFLYRIGLSTCRIMANCVSAFGLLSRCLEIFMDQFGLRSTCMVFYPDKLGLSRRMVHYIAVIGLHTGMVIFQDKIGLLAVGCLVWDYIKTILKTFATFQVMVWGEVDSEKEHGRVAHQCPGRNKRATP